MALLLKIRKALAKSSTAKYAAFQRCAASDGRVRGTLIYHGASTGRWGGALIQPQNFPRGIVKDVSEAIHQIMSLCVDDLKMLYGENLMPLFSSVLRGMFIASEGKELFVEDWNAIETRVTFWLAGHEKGLQSFRDGVDLYKVQAAQIYKKNIGEITDTERQVGKAAILGCFEKNTRVLTNTGWKKIIDVKLTDKLWDGVEWVAHSGLIYQGKKKTVRLLGLKLTPKHLLLTRRGWVEAEAALKDKIHFQQSALGLADLSSSGIGPASGAGLWAFKSNAIAGHKRTWFFLVTYYAGSLSSVICALEKILTIGKKNFIRTLVPCPTINTARACSIGLAPQSAGATAQPTNGQSITGAGAFPFSVNGAQIRRPFLPIFKPFPVGITRYLKWTEKIIMEIMNREIFAFQLEKKMCIIGAALGKCKNALTPLKPVYDIANAGPRNRFVVWTNAGPIIAHNCGYQMGPKKFASAASDVYRVNIPLDLAKVAVTAYRESNFPVVEMWGNYQNAAIAAIEHPGAVYKANKVRFCVKNKFLILELPGGKKLYYKDPSAPMEKVEIKDDDGNITNTFMAKKVKYWAVNSLSKKWNSEATYGGKLTENIVQSVSRGLLAEAIVRAEENGFEVLMHSHDELVVEAIKGKKTTKEFRQIMETLPTWAAGLPLKSGGFSATRYRKG